MTREVIEGDKTPVPFTINGVLDGSSTAKIFLYDLVTQVSIEAKDFGTVAAPPGSVVTWTPNGLAPRGSYVTEVEVMNGAAGPFTYPSDRRDRPRLDIVADLG